MANYQLSQEERRARKAARLRETPPQATQTTVSVDWLTLTAMSEEMRDLLYDTARGTIEELRRQKLPVKEWKFKGYTGFACEGVRAGSRTDSDIVIISGLWATEYWMLFAPLAENCSRVDIAVTCELAEPIPDLTGFYWQHLPDKDAQAKLKLPRYTIIFNTDGGTTLYVGARSSAQMGRVYDKGLEAKIADPGKIWRYEVEYKHPCSGQILDRLLAHVHNPGIAEQMRATVFNWFSSRQVKPIFLNEGQAWLVDTETKVTSDDIKLNWITTQVRPSVAGLVDRGRAEEVIQALGLENYIAQQRGGFDGNEHKVP